MREYEAGIIALHSQEGMRDRQIQRGELDLSIDLRLGVDFPAERRDALWQVHQRLETGPLSMLRAWVTGLLSRRKLEQHGTQAAQQLMTSYASVLDPQELRDFLGDPPQESIR